MYKTPKLLRAYRAALRRYLNGAPNFDLSEAAKLGLGAHKSGLEILDLARLHEEATVDLVLKRSDIRSDDMIRQAGTFFEAAIRPMEGRSGTASAKNVQIQAAMDELSQRSVQLAASNEELKIEIQRRIVVEKSLKTSEATTSKLLKESLNLQEELRSLSRRHFTAQEEERKRISRELHDVVAQALTGINIRLASLTLQTQSNSKDIQKKIALTQRLVEKSVNVVHRFACDLRPTVLDDLGLIPALKAYLKEFMKSSNMKSSFTAFPRVESLSSEEKTALYRVAQEALVNVIRHSEATIATVTIRKRKDVISMKVHDDGIGFTISDRKTSKGKQSLGLLGMRERVEMVGGKFSVVSKPGKGTTVQVDLDLNKTNSGKILAAA